MFFVWVYWGGIRSVVDPPLRWDDLKLLWIIPELSRVHLFKAHTHTYIYIIYIYMCVYTYMPINKVIWYIMVHDDILQ
jgi:hypothetical protein